MFTCTSTVTGAVRGHSMVESMGNIVHWSNPLAFTWTTKIGTASSAFVHVSGPDNPQSRQSTKWSPHSHHHSQQQPQHYLYSPSTVVSQGQNSILMKHSASSIGRLKYEKPLVYSLRQIGCLLFIFICFYTRLLRTVSTGAHRAVVISVIACKMIWSRSQIKSCKAQNESFSIHKQRGFFWHAG